MHFSDATAYVFTLMALTLAPGPLVMLLMVRAASNDKSGALGFSLGIALGDALMIAAICLGLGVWLQSTPMVQEYGQVALLMYLGWLASEIWNGKFTFCANARGTRSGLLVSLAAGAMTCVISPQTVALYALLLPSVVNLSAPLAPDVLVTLCALTFLALALCFGLVIALAAPLRRLAQNAAHVTTLNRALSGTLMLTGLWIVTG